MKFLSVRELRNTPGKVWSQLEEDDLVVTSNGKPVGILVGVADGRIEETLAALRRAKAAIAVSRMREQARTAGTSRLSARKVESQIRAVRRRHPPA